MPHRWSDILELPLAQLPGGELTPGSLLVGTGVALASLLVARHAGRGTSRALRARGLASGPGFAASRMVHDGVAALGILVALRSIGVTVDALVATSTMFFVGVEFGLQAIARDFVSGLILLLEHSIRHGDVVDVGGLVGVAEDIGLRATRVTSDDGVTILIPSSDLVTKRVINQSTRTPKRQIRIPVGVASGSDTALVHDTLPAVAAASPDVLAAPSAQVRFEAFGAWSLDFALLVWVAEPSMDFAAASALRAAIDVSFRQARIDIPLPQRVVRVFVDGRSHSNGS